jgi:hypothetical protein
MQPGKKTMTLEKLTPLLFVVGLSLTACKLDSTSLLGGNPQESAVQKSEPAPTPAPKTTPNSPGQSTGGGTFNASGKCTYATLRARNKAPDKGCLPPGGPSNWLAKAYFGKDVPGGVVADGPVMRLVLRFLRDGSKPVLANEVLNFESKLKLPASMDCKTVPSEFAWQAVVYDCRWQGTPPDQEFLLRAITIANSRCAASTELTLEFDDGPDCLHEAAPFGYPKIFLGHGILMPPMVVK